ncbi:MAG TPA: hypothetical protein VFF63_04915 [Candidatus Babeliales bacterium]|nr:hypothetical protein [Candidatus Babeliales bacterium]
MAVGAFFLGASLLFTIGAFSRTNESPAGKVVDKTCNSDNYCFVEDNYGTRGAFNGVSEANDAISILGNADGEGATGVWASVFDGFPLVSVGTSTNDAEFYTDSSGDGVFDGDVYAAGYGYDIRNNEGTRVSASVALAPRTTIEDSGTAKMTEGLGVVRFDPAFARTLDLRSGYQVFLTPDGDTRGLYVAQKYEGGFVVRENEHGRS